MTTYISWDTHAPHLPMPARNPAMFYAPTPTNVGLYDAVADPQRAPREQVRNAHRPPRATGYALSGTFHTREEPGTCPPSELPALHLTHSWDLRIPLPAQEPDDRPHNHTESAGAGAGGASRYHAQEFTLHVSLHYYDGRWQPCATAGMLDVISQDDYEPLTRYNVPLPATTEAELFPDLRTVPADVLPFADLIGHSVRFAEAIAVETWRGLWADLLTCEEERDRERIERAQRILQNSLARHRLDQCQLYLTTLEDRDLAAVGRGIVAQGWSGTAAELASTLTALTHSPTVS